jgi:integrase
VTDKPEIPVGNPMAEAKVEKLRRAVFKPRQIPKVPALRGNSYRLNLGTDKDGKAVEQRVGSDKKFAEAFRKAWNAAIERTDGTAILTELSELARLDVRKALLLLKDYSSIELADCVQFYINHALPESGIITVKNGVERYMEIQKEKNLGEVSTDEKGTTYKTYIKPFKDHFGDKLHLIQLTPEKATAYLNKRSGNKKNWSSGHWNHHRNRLIAMWNTLAKRKYCSAALNPFEDVVVLSTRGDSGGQSKKVTQHAEAEKFFRWLEKECEKYPSKYPELALSVVGWFCGIRVEEIGRVGWEDLDREAEQGGDSERKDFTGWEITVWANKEKMGISKVNPVPENAKEWLSLCRKHWKNEAITKACTYDSFAAADHPQRMKKLRGKFTKETGIKLPQNTARHSFASHHLALWGDAKLTAERLGHKGDASTLNQWYRAGMKPSYAEKYFKIIPEVSEKRLATEAKAKAEAEDQAAYEDALSHSHGAGPIKDEYGKWHPVTLDDHDFT